MVIRNMNVIFVVIFVLLILMEHSISTLPTARIDKKRIPTIQKYTPPRAAHKIEKDVASRRQNTGHRARNFCDHVMMRFKHANKLFCYPCAPVMMRVSQARK